MESNIANAHVGSQRIGTVQQSARIHDRDQPRGADPTAATMVRKASDNRSSAVPIAREGMNKCQAKKL
jgi:hypothetical protein